MSAENSKMNGIHTILLTIDALRPDHLPQYGYERNTLEVLSELETDGHRFEQAYATGTNSGLSIPSFLTSRLIGRAQFNSKTVASPLQSNGIKTAGFHSNVLLTSQLPTPSDFDTWDDFNIGREDINNDLTSSTVLEKFYNQLKRALGPYLQDIDVVRRIHDWFVPNTYSHPVTPYVDAEETLRKVRDWIDPEYTDDTFLWTHLMDPHRPYAFGLSEMEYGDTTLTSADIIELMAKAGRDPEAITLSERETLIDLYDSEIHNLNYNISTFFEYLQSTGLWERTNLIITADHGEEFGEHGLYYHRNLPYDELIRVPLFVKFADSIDRCPLDESALVSLLDLGPTICDLHDVSVPDSFEGRSLFSDRPNHVPLVGSPGDGGDVVGVRSRDWKLIRRTDDNDLLFDIESDPSERQSVHDAFPDQATQLAQHCPVGPREIAEKPVEVADDTVRSQLESLGYLE